MSTLDRLISRPLPRPFPRILGVRPVLVGAFLVVACLGLLQVAQTSSATTTGYNLQRLEDERFATQAEVHQLEAEVAVLTSIDRIDREARDRLGMVPAGNTMTLEVHKQPPEQQLVPLRFLTESKEPQVETSSWWQKLLNLLPFF
jgi:cell division protein FtsL